MSVKLSCGHFSSFEKSSPAHFEIKWGYYKARLSHCYKVYWKGCNNGIVMPVTTHCYKRTRIPKTYSQTFQTRLIWVLFKLGLSCEPRKIGPHIYWAFKDNIWRRWLRVSVSRPAAVSNACSRDIPIHRKLEEKWQIGSRVRGKCQMRPHIIKGPDLPHLWADLPSDLYADLPSAPFARNSQSSLSRYWRGAASAAQRKFANIRIVLTGFHICYH